MNEKITEKEHKQRLDSVIDYILKNLNNNISLQSLASVANYSPFHLQKIFKQYIGESPKQYIIKLRLETAFHIMIIHPHKSINEIALDCGFSSPAVFSRAIKNYFGHSPEQLRNLTPKERLKALSKSTPHTPPFGENKEPNLKSKLEVRVVKIKSIFGVYLLAPFDDGKQIQQSFRNLYQKLKAKDIISNEPTFYGILSPHQGNIYKSFIELDERNIALDKFHQTEIKGGKYAVFKVKGNKQQTLKSVQYFYHYWLSNNGYRIGDVVGFEKFSGNPYEIPYEKMERELFVPIEPI